MLWVCLILIHPFFEVPPPPPTLPPPPPPKKKKKKKKLKFIKLAILNSITQEFYKEVMKENIKTVKMSNIDLF